MRRTVRIMTFERSSRSEGFRAPEKYHFNPAMRAIHGRVRRIG